jgi:hypothetical protein
MELTKQYFDEQVSKLITKEQAQDFATKDDLLELATKNDLGSVRSDIAEIKAIVQRIDQRTDEDTRALGRDVADLKRRGSALER